MCAILPYVYVWREAMRILVRDQQYRRRSAQHKPTIRHNLTSLVCRGGTGVVLTGMALIRRVMLDVGT